MKFNKSKIFPITTKIPDRIKRESWEINSVIKQIHIIHMVEEKDPITGNSNPFFHISEDFPLKKAPQKDDWFWELLQKYRG